MSDSLGVQVAYWRQKVNADPAMLDQVIRAMLLARQTQAKVEADAKAAAIYDANVGDKLKVEIKYLSNQLEAAGQWKTQVPWSALCTVLDAAYQFAEGNAELWADCEQVQTWVEGHEIGDESCATIHPETWAGVQP